MLRDCSRRFRFPALCATILFFACGDDTGPHDGGVSAPSGLVAVGSDYSVASVSLLDRDGNVGRDGCLLSGSGPATMTMTLSGDVALPTQVPAGGPVAIIDRGNTALTWIDPMSCGVLGQLGVGTGFASNPHDYVMLSPQKAYVPRQDANKNATPSPDDFDDGNDVLIVDPAQPKIVGRIDLTPLAPVGVLPRADRALAADGKVFVSLNAISDDYQVYGTGRILVIDPTTDQVAATIDLPGLQNCGALTFAPSLHRLIVACNGAYSGGSAQAATSGIAAIDVSQSPPAVVAQIAATSVGTAAFSNLTIATIGGTIALVVAEGTISASPPDSLWAVPLDGSAPTKLFDSAEGFAVGAVLYDDAHARVLAADATMATPAFLRLFAYASGSFAPAGTVKTNPAQKLPPRALAFY